MMLICVALGCYGYKEDMNIMFLSYWGMLGLINGMMDVVRIIDFVVHSPLPLFATEAPMVYNLSNGVMVASPLSLVLGAWTAYKVYKAPSHSSEAPSESSYGGAVWSQPSNQVFSGEGQRLGNN